MRVLHVTAEIQPSECTGILPHSIDEGQLAKQRIQSLRIGSPYSGELSPGAWLEEGCSVPSALSHGSRLWKPTLQSWGIIFSCWVSWKAIGLLYVLLDLHQTQWRHLKVQTICHAAQALYPWPETPFAPHQSLGTKKGSQLWFIEGQRTANFFEIFFFPSQICPNSIEFTFLSGTHRNTCMMKVEPKRKPPTVVHYC